MASRFLLLGTIAAALTFLPSFSAGAVSYTVVDLTPPGMASARAVGISADGLQQVGQVAPTGNDYGHAILWSGTAGSAIDLHPANSPFFGSAAVAASGAQQVGGGSLPSSLSQLGFVSHALLWTGSAESCIDLNPDGFISSCAFATNGRQQFGSGLQPNPDGVQGSHCMLWSGTPQSYVDLNPPGFRETRPGGMDDTRQVGFGEAEGLSGDHALLWSGTAESCIDLHPNWLSDSLALAISGNEQVGEGYDVATMGNNPHALLWTGTADSCVDLNPAGFDTSSALGTNGSIQVGLGLVPGGPNWYLNPPRHHALMWTGSAESCVDLQQFLPVGFTDSEAYAVDSNGDIVGWATDAFGSHAVMWVPVPEPGAIVLVVISGTALICRHSRAGMSRRKQPGQS